VSAKAKHENTDLGAGVMGLHMLQATLNNLANLSLSSAVGRLCELSIAGGTSGGVGSLSTTSSGFAPTLLVLKVIFAEGLQNPKRNKILSIIFQYNKVQKLSHILNSTTSESLSWG